jgi:hypothetical protein
VKPIASGPGLLPDCVAGKLHVFPPSAVWCRCGATNRQPSPLGAIVVEPDRKAQIA